MKTDTCDSRLKAENSYNETITTTKAGFREKPLVNQIRSVLALPDDIATKVEGVLANIKSKINNHPSSLNQDLYFLIVMYIHNGRGGWWESRKFANF